MPLLIAFGLLFAGSPAQAAPWLSVSLAAAGVTEPDPSSTVFDRFPYPAAFAVDETAGITLLIDGSGRRLLRFDAKTTVPVAIPLPPGSRAIDLDWRPATGRLTLERDDTDELALFAFDPAANRLTAAGTKAKTEPFRLDKRPAELAPPQGDAVGCRVVHPVGADDAGNLYLETRFGPSDENLPDAYVYRLDPAGRLAGRVAIPAEPGLSVNRSVVIGGNGAVYAASVDKSGKLFIIERFVIEDRN